MKFLLATIILILSILLSACGNDRIDYGSDYLESARFIKTEKLKNGTNELNCEYGNTSHLHKQGDSYYLYFTLTSLKNSPINPESPRFPDIQKQLSIDFKIKDAQGKYQKDNSINIGKIEYVPLGKNLKKRQNFNFLIDLSNNNDLDINNKNKHSLSGGLTTIDFRDMLNKISFALLNLYENYDQEYSYFIEDEFLGVRYFAFSAGDESNWLIKMISSYITDMDMCLGGSMNMGGNARKILCWLKLNDAEAYNGLKNQSSKYHRKLYDAYIATADIVKSDKNKNKNILLFTDGYDESFYDVKNELDSSNKSVHSEDDFFNAITAGDNIPVFIAPEDRTDSKSFPDTTATTIDDKFYKLACLTNGAYFPYIFKDNTWIPTKGANHYSTQYIMGNIKDASYGMWRVKITLNSNTTDRYYDGAFIVKAKSNTNEVLETPLTGYRIVK